MTPKTSEIRFTRMVFLVMTLLIALTPARAQDPPAPEPAVRATIDQWRDTLRWGINSQIVELIPIITEQREARVADEILSIFRGSSDTNVLRAALGYLRRMELPDGQSRALELLADFQSRPAELNAALLSYLADLKEPIPLDADQLSLMRQIAAHSNVLHAAAAVRVMAVAGVATTELVELYRQDGVTEDARGQILLSLGERRDPDAYSFIVELLEPDQDATTLLQRYAIDALGKLGLPQAIPVLRRQLGAADALTRAYAVSALSRFAEIAQEVLLTGLRDDFWRVRVNSLLAVAEARHAALLEIVIYKMREDPEPRVRAEAIRTLVALDRPEGWAALEDRARQRRTPITERMTLVTVLIEHRPRQSLETLTSIMDEQWTATDGRLLDAIGRATAAHAAGVPPAVIERLFNHENYIIQIYAARAAAAAGLRSARELLTDRTQAGRHPALRSAATQALSDLGYPVADR